MQFSVLCQKRVDPSTHAHTTHTHPSTRNSTPSSTHTQALRDVDDVHDAWAHRVPEDRMVQLSAPVLDGSFGAFHVALRILFMVSTH